MEEMPQWIRACVISSEPVILRTTGSKSLRVSSTIYPAQREPVRTVSLIDCGAAGFGFMDRAVARHIGVPLYNLPHRRNLLLADGKPADVLEHYTVVPLEVGHHREHALFYITNLSKKDPTILGLPWLERHNPMIDWADHRLTFASHYCLKCCTGGRPVEAPTVKDSGWRQPWVEDEEELPEKVSGLPSASEILMMRSIQRPKATVEDAPEEAFEQTGASEMDIPSTLSPGVNYYRTRAIGNPQQESRAQMIPNQKKTRPLPAGLAAGKRAVTTATRNKTLPPLSAPLPVPQPDPDNMKRPDTGDIRMVTANSFTQFCRDSSVKAMRVTWEELDRMEKEHHHRRIELPELSEDEYRGILQGEAMPTTIHRLFPAEVQEFLTWCSNGVDLRRGITDADIEKFISKTDRPLATTEEILRKLPGWLHDLKEGFLPSIANALPPQRPWDHRIEITPGMEPPYIKSRPMSPAELRVVRKWLDDNLSKGFIRESRSRCAAPLLLAAKPGGGVRICQDYRGLNNVTVKNRYPLPLIRETLNAVCNAKVFTKLDIIAAFNKLRIAEGHEWKTAFITRFGLFESLVMPFGLCNAPASFQNYINHTLFDLLDKTCTAYLDDILIYSDSKKDHRQHVREVVQRLIDAGLQIDIDKCEFETTKTKYLGLIVTPNGIEMDPEKVKTITEWQAPTSLKDLQRFLGFANFYRRFIQGFSKVTNPLNTLMRKGTAWSWGLEQDTAFRSLKEAFCNAPILAIYDYSRKTVVETDASDWAAGGVLSQYDDEKRLRPVAYFSAKHSPAECNYEIYDKELLAIVKSLEEWRPELHGTQDPFEIVTDHKNLEYFTTTKSLNQRQARWAEFLSGFNFRITYRPGIKAARPDALSRKAEDRPSAANPNDNRLKNREQTLLPKERFDDEAFRDLVAETNEMGDIPALPMGMLVPDAEKPLDDLVDAAYAKSDIVAVMRDTLRNPRTRKWPKSIRRQLRVALQDCKLINDRVYYRDRLFVPPDDELRTQIIYRTHSSASGGHPGRLKTVDLVSRTFWWPNLTREVETFVQACHLCVRTKASRSSPQGYLEPLSVPFRAWSDISVDYITPLPECQRNGLKYKHIAVVVCRLTKMRHLIPTEGLTAEELANAFVSRVYCLHGTPDNIVSDRGVQFVSEFWRHISERLGITLKHSSSFHPETDGQTERVNAMVEQYLRAYMNFYQDDWVDWLPLAEFATNNAVSETTGVSPFFANYGFNPRLGTEPSQPVPPNLSAHQKKEFLKANHVIDRFDRVITRLKALARDSIRRYEANANESRSDAPLYCVGDRVWVSTANMKTNRPMKKGDDRWTGPYEVEAVYKRACRLKLPEGVKIFPVFHNSLLRPLHDSKGLPGQERINEAEARRNLGRVLERDDGTNEVVEKWEFERIEDCHDEDGLNYLVKWKHHAATWQPAEDLKGQDNVLIAFHTANPRKPSPPPWIEMPEGWRRKPELEAPGPAPTRPALRRSNRRTAALRGVDRELPKVVRFDPVVRVFHDVSGHSRTNGSLGGGTVTAQNLTLGHVSKRSLRPTRSLRPCLRA
jgi:hypothetical protein